MRNICLVPPRSLYGNSTYSTYIIISSTSQNNYNPCCNSSLQDHYRLKSDVSTQSINAKNVRIDTDFQPTGSLCSKFTITTLSYVWCVKTSLLSLLLSLSQRSNLSAPSPAPSPREKRQVTKTRPSGSGALASKLAQLPENASPCFGINF